MTQAKWRYGTVACLTEKAFWSDTIKEVACLIGASSNGFGLVLVAMVSNIGHRIA
jgi:hypothetical protein